MNNLSCKYLSSEIDGAGLIAKTADFLTINSYG